MLSDDRVRSLDDYLNASMCSWVGLKVASVAFSGIEITPALRRHDALQGREPVGRTRKLLRTDRCVRALQPRLSILRKVVAVETGQNDSLALPKQSVSTS